MTHSWFVTCPGGTEALLAAELRACGAPLPQPSRAGVACHGPLELAYRICLWSRVANRVLLTLARFHAPTAEALYAGVHAVDWAAHLAPTGTLAVDAWVQSSHITHSNYAALRVKDAVVDQFRQRNGVRPSVDRSRPDLRLNLYLFRDEARLSLDLSGDSLHRRGYREDGGFAPLKENLAAALLLLADWPRIAQTGAGLFDPLCGSGTLLIEAALLAGDIAPGSLGRSFGFETWLNHDTALWQQLLTEARERRRASCTQLPPIYGFDGDQQAVRGAVHNLQRAGLTTAVRIAQRELSNAKLPLDLMPGLLITNPPYGERLGTGDKLIQVYQNLGRLLHEQFQTWHAAIFTGNPPLMRYLDLLPSATQALYNGALPCQLFHYRPTTNSVPALTAPVPTQPLIRPGGSALLNRLTKNLKHLGRWARRSSIHCYRLYDADLPDYAAAVDLYQAEELWAVVQEYAAPPTVDPDLAHQRLQELLSTVAQLLQLPNQRICLKIRSRQRGTAQYAKLGALGTLYPIQEGPCRLLVNFTDYLDTGLFLDHRLTRNLIYSLASGRDFLNLFAYTGSASVYAAIGGATTTTSLDLSATYLQWAQRNLALNGFTTAAHCCLRVDCIRWLAEMVQDPNQPRYGLIFLDPPTFSSSKRMDGVLDLQRDHAVLIRQAAELLTPAGVLIFSTNYRRFRLDYDALSGLKITDLSALTLPEDFRRQPRIHACWRITQH